MYYFRITTCMFILQMTAKTLPKYFEIILMVFGQSRCFKTHIRFLQEPLNDFFLILHAAKSFFWTFELLQFIYLIISKGNTKNQDGIRLVLRISSSLRGQEEYHQRYKQWVFYFCKVFICIN